MTKLGNLYTDFSRIDLDTRGGYARVADVIARQDDGGSIHRAFKLMRHEIDYQKGLEHFEDELQVLVAITSDSEAPSTITRIYDSGFAPVELSRCLHEREVPDPNLEIVSTGTDIQKFLEMKLEKEPDQWLPYLVVELAPYDDNLLRQIHNQPKEDPLGLYRLPIGEVIAMAFQLFDVVDYLREKHRRVYMDWKPEHLFWSGLKREIKLIDWNVTSLLDEGPGEKQNIRDDLRLFCGAVLYIGLTFVDPDDPTKPIGPRPTKEPDSPIPEIRRRYWTDFPVFYQRDSLLDSRIKEIIQQGLDPKQGFDSVQDLKAALAEYGQQVLGITQSELILGSEPASPYFKALTEMRLAQRQLLFAQQHLIEAVGTRGRALEFTRSFNAIKKALKNTPVS